MKGKIVLSWFSSRNNLHAAVILGIPAAQQFGLIEFVLVLIEERVGWKISRVAVLSCQRTTTESFSRIFTGTNSPLHHSWGWQRQDLPVISLFKRQDAKTIGLHFLLSSLPVFKFSLKLPFGSNVLPHGFSELFFFVHCINAACTVHDYGNAST